MVGAFLDSVARGWQAQARLEQKPEIEAAPHASFERLLARYRELHPHPGEGVKNEFSISLHDGWAGKAGSLRVALRVRAVWMCPFDDGWIIKNQRCIRSRGPACLFQHDRNGRFLFAVQIAESRTVNNTRPPPLGPSLTHTFQFVPFQTER